MTPNARAALATASFPVIVSSRNLNDRAHLRVVARTRRLDRMVRKLLDQTENIDLPAKISLASDLHYMAASTLTLWQMLGRRGPWLVPRPGGSWKVFAQHLEALKALIEYMRRIGPPVRAWLQPPAAAGLVRALTRLAAGLSGTGRQVAIPGCSYGMENLTEEIRQRHGKRTVEIRGATGTWRDLVHPFRSVLQAVTGKTVIAAIAAPKPLPAVESALAEVWSRLPDPVVREGLLPYRSRLLSEAALAQSLADEMAHILDRTAVRSVLLNALHWGADVALAAAAGRRGIPRFLVSHGTHSSGQTTAADAEQRALAEGQLVSSLADLAVTQSPHADTLAAAMMPELPRRAFRPAMWGYKPMPERRRTGGGRRVLHAGTYKRLAGMRPWIYETSNEFVDGLRDLIGAVDDLSDTWLTIRVRPMPECDIESLRQLLPHSDCYEVKTDGSFLDDLAEADLLVSYASTTIEEALNARRPVLLWGGSSRYRHLPAATEAPSADRRSAVYAADDAAHLGALLPAILTHHAEAPLLDEEVAGHVWPTDTPGIDGLAKTIAEGGVPL